MYTLEYTTQFRKDLKRVAKQGLDIELLRSVLRQLETNGQVGPEHRPHKLSGNWQGTWECHITPDWLLLYDLFDTVRIARLVRTGSHSKILKK